MFEDVRVSAENLLGEENKGFYYLMQKLQQERNMLAITAIKSCEIMLEMTSNYVKKSHRIRSDRSSSIPKYSIQVSGKWLQKYPLGVIMLII